MESGAGANIAVRPGDSLAAVSPGSVPPGMSGMPGTSGTPLPGSAATGRPDGGVLSGVPVGQEALPFARGISGLPEAGGPASFPLSGEAAGPGRAPEAPLPGSRVSDTAMPVAWSRPESTVVMAQPAPGHGDAIAGMGAMEAMDEAAATQREVASAVGIVDSVAGQGSERNVTTPPGPLAAFSGEFVDGRQAGAERLPSAVPASGGAPGAEQALARHASLQVVAAAQGRPGDSVALTLSPEELGRVHLQFHGQNGSMTVSLTIERPETLDLMRRHIETLTQELRNIGYREVNIGFGQEGARQGGFGYGHGPGPELQTGDGTSEPHSSPPEDMSPPRRLSGGTADAGIDIRL